MISTAHKVNGRNNTKRLLKPAHIVSSTHVAADGFAKARQEAFLVTVGNLFNDAECIHLLLLSNPLRNQRKCISTIYNQRKSM